MRILVTGSRGQVVSSLVELSATRPDIHLVAVGRPALDLTDAASIRRAIVAANPDVVVSAAAYTAVDRAEDDRDTAYQVNVIGAANVAEAAAALRVPVIHISTDYVFSGSADHPYKEDDEPQPKTVYGYTKLRGEHAVACANPRHFILRTSWVYSPFGVNFVKTMLRLACERRTVQVVSDQWGNPTCALDLAAAILQVATNPVADRYGIYHVTGTGETTWAGFARRVFAASQAAGGPFAEVLDIVSADYRTKAVRPANSRLNCDRFESAFGWRAPPWQASTDAVVQRMLQADHINLSQRTGV
jgi:dTDP-4-dehydrorhamnose reductase